MPMHFFVGCRTAKVPDDDLGLCIPLTILYPTATPGLLQAVGPYQLDVAIEAPVGAGPFPVVVISHGTGGSGLTHRNLAHYLARHGYVVALPEHPHNNRLDNRWANTPQNLVARPRHVQVVLDFLFQDSPLKLALKPDGACLIGHSLGGYTALALAGGQPWAVAPEEADAPLIPVPTADPRVRALVLLAPAVPWFAAAGSLRGVQQPILLLAGEKDEHTPPLHVETVRNGVPDATHVTYRIIDNAGHYSFLSPFPAERVSPQFPPSQDPPGFNRILFHAELYPVIESFLRQWLGY